MTHSSFDHRKYRPYPRVDRPQRRWPDRVIEHAPLWCSVDLRDGNQALIEPMNVAQKRETFELLVRLGFKEIEVGFPAASQPDFDFVRDLIEHERIPDDVTVQVLTQARPELIARSFEALAGAPRAIMHLYNSTSTVQRKHVFALDRAGVKSIATEGAQCVREHAARYPETDWTFQYSPESFTGTELDYALEVCNAVLDVWGACADKPCIINLPATVEMTTPNVFADQVEWMSDGLAPRDGVVLSVHTHNDRGCAVAAGELAVMAGAQRVEGTLLGNGERTGNMDIVTMAMNLYSRGVDPRLDLSRMDEIIRCVKACTRLPVHPRHPYAGELVFTAFSGSHQDAIRKCLDSRRPDDPWDVAYLPIEPADLGRDYQEVIRINSQSGKGGVAFVLEQTRGLRIPRWLQIDFSTRVQRYAEDHECEVAPDTIVALFEQHYLSSAVPLELTAYELARSEGRESIQARLSVHGRDITLGATGGGAVDAFVSALCDHFGRDIAVIDYSEHSLNDGSGTEDQAAAYVYLSVDGRRFCGVGRSHDIVEASLTAIVAAINQSLGTAADIAA